ncbi:MAG: D-alanyl-D-alanine carboxypeptidase/D-alanyl-D-alanine-endopeptidase [Amaricoccus sp.]|uniref:D-alanyl-D-alanine carboxypeptidase/D-alanyl-D-alanine endopeptidase n=1 Tax=Amaricoccus sp. TaxID=1872485 RepID=UPI0039E4DD03
MRTTRRSLLIAGAASLVAARARAADEDLRPRPRAPGGTGGSGGGPGAAPPDSLDAIFARSGLRPSTGFVVVDLETGATLEAEAPDVPRPPASVQKIVTALYAHETLGQDYRFATRLLATGPIGGGRLDGDLVLAGDGDPTLDTDALGALVAGLRAGGVAAVAGRLRVAEGALPVSEAVDDAQPADAAYNPGVSGLNLNFNRVFAGWKAGGDGLAFSAPGERFEVAVDGIRGEAADVALPARRLTDDAEIWTLPRAGMRRSGSLWLPVAHAGRYAGEVFRGLAGQRGLILPQAERVSAPPAGALVGLGLSPPLDTILRDMLRFSTNLTAEVVGLRASQARGLAPAGFAPSAAAMAGWAGGRGLDPAHLVNHSGLSGAARVTPAALARFLQSAAPTALPELMPSRPILDDAGKPAEIDVTARVKTGTLDFASGLAGYLTGRRRLGFAILVADLDRRAALGPAERADPPGGDAWTARARRQEQALLRRWARVYVG